MAALLVSTVVQAAQAPQVIVEPVRQASLVDPVEALGTLRANESVTLTALVAEKVSRVHFTDNQRVEAGQLLVEMTSAEEQALLQEALVDRDESARQLERVRSLARQGSASQAQLDEQRRAYKTAEARLTAIESRLGDRVITAPFAGVVGLRQISPGALVSPGELITTLDDDSVMKLDFTVPSVFLPHLEPGLAIEAMARAYPEQPFSGEVAAVDSRVDPVSRTVVVRALIENPTHLLRPGLLMTVTLLSNPRDALVVPEEAVLAEGDSTYVFRVVRGDAQTSVGTSVKKVAVQVGARQPGLVEILSGLDQGDQVVTHGHQKVRDGAAVSPRERKDGESIPDIIRAAEIR
jgi:membrane fusion protein (multidrug efflux system)